QQDLVHGGDGERPGTGGSALEHFDVVDRRDMDDDASLLHLAIEPPRCRAGHFDLRVDHALEGACLIRVDSCVDVSALGCHLKSGIAGRSVQYVGSPNLRADRYQPAIVDGMTQVLEGGRNGAGQAAVAEQLEVAAQNK